jgi:hypothetical protein
MPGRVFPESVAGYGRNTQLRSLDSIQLGCASLVRSEIDFFVVCDKKLLTSAVEEGLTVINPSEPE